MTTVNKPLTAPPTGSPGLHPSEARFRDLVENTNDFVWEVDAQGRYTFASRRVKEMLGYEPEEILGRTPFDLMPPEEAVRIRAVFEPAAARKEPFTNLQNLNLHKDGREVVLETNGVPVIDGEGNLQGYRGVDRDITERLRTEKNLRQSAEDLSAIYHQAPIMMALVDKQENLHRVNPYLLRFIGLPEAEVIGRRLGNVMHCINSRLDERGCGFSHACDNCPVAIAKQTSAQLGATRQPVEGRMVFKTPQGQREAFVEVSATNVKVGPETLMLICLNDITKKTIAEQKVRQQAALLDITHDAIYVQDLAGQIVFWNQGALTLYGWTATEAQQQPVGELLFAPKYGLQREALATTLEKNEWVGELVQKTKTGREIIVQSRWSLKLDTHGQPEAILVVNTDLTEKKKLESKYLRAQRMESIGTLAAGIAHDLNNVLAPILMGLQSMQEDLHDEYLLDIAKTLEGSAQRGADIVRQVLTFGRGMEGTQIPVQIKHIIKEIHRLMRETFPRNLQIFVDTCREPWIVTGDITQLQQVLMNLCVNARDAMPAGGILSITLENRILTKDEIPDRPKSLPGTWIMVRVADTGTGIPPEILDKIFDPFFTTKPAGQGTGLGLATSIGIVESHHGFIRVHSELNKGSAFEVFLPATEATQIQTTQPVVEQLPDGTGQLILVVDDEAALRRLLENVLKRHGYKVLTARDGFEAIKLFEQNQAAIEVVVSDIMMPNMDGLNAIKGIRQIKPQAKILAISGVGATTKANEALEAGARAFIAKPFSNTDLLRYVAQLAAKS